jgi:hypothetical protein
MNAHVHPQAAHVRVATVIRVEKGAHAEMLTELRRRAKVDTLATNDESTLRVRHY